ncbi:hypothetical protein D3C72_134140 [compost metagenome]
MKRRIFFKTSFGVCLLASPAFLVTRLAQADARIANINDAINKSGRQRMLSQRLAKCYLQIGQAIDLPRSQKLFDISLALFEKQLGNLEAFAPNAENKATLAELKKSWSAYKTVLLARAPNQQDAKVVMRLSDEVLALAHSATLQLEKSSDTSVGHLVNIAGRQRMLSQRMAKFYQAINWGVAAGDALGNLVKARDEFLRAMTELSASPSNTQAIKQEITLAQQQWFFFDQALKSSAISDDSKLRFANNVATSSERILETMDKITGLYEQLG